MHTFRALPEPANADWVLATTEYGGEFVSAVKRGEVPARARPALCALLLGGGLREHHVRVI